MNPRIIALAALAAVSILTATSPAQARRHPAPQYGVSTMTNEGHYAPATIAAAPAQARRSRHAGRRAPARAVKTAALHRATAEREITAPAPSQAPPAGTLRAGEKYNPGNGMLTARTPYGFAVTLHPAYMAKFLKLFALMKAKHYVIPAKLINAYNAGLGGYARGHHVPGSNHYIGAAFDLQWDFGKGPAFVYTKEFAGMIRAAGLYNGGRFGDWGHVEAQTGTHNRAPNSKLALEHFLRDREAAETDEALAWAEPTTIAPAVIEVSAHKGRRHHHHHRRIAANQLN